MSNYRALAYHPVTGRLEVADWLDDFYGKRVYGVRFADGHTRHAHKIRTPSTVDLFLVAQEMAEALREIDEMPDEPPPGNICTQSDWLAYARARQQAIARSALTRAREAGYGEQPFRPAVPPR